MNKNNIIGIIIGALIVFIVVSRINFNFDIPSLPSWSDSVDKILITNLGKKIDLNIYKEKNNWYINKEKFPADKNKIKNILNALKNLEITEHVSDKGLFKNYGLDIKDASKVIVKAKNKTIRDLYFGNKSSTNHTFVRVSNKKDVFLVSGVFRDYGKKIDHFRDKELVKINKNAIASFNVMHRGQTFSFYQKIEEKKKDKKNKKKGKKKGIWKCKGYEFTKLDKNKVEGIVSIFSPLRANTFLNIKKSELEKKFPTAELKVAAFGKTVSLKLFEEKDPKDKKGKRKIYKAITSESPYVFTVSSWKANKVLLKNIEAVKAKK